MSTTTSRRNVLRPLALALALSISATACGSATAATEADGSASSVTIAESATAGLTGTSSGDFYDSSIVHDIDVDFDTEDLDSVIASYLASGEKEWMEVTVHIDGTTYENVGMRLKGNSSLFSLSAASAESPEDLPWLIRFDKYIDDQNHQGYNDIVIRSNSTETSMNEAVAAELLEAAGLAAQQAVSTTLSFNGGETELRLAMQNPDEVWEASNFDVEESALYKADSEGDYSYRGDDVEAYDEVFDQKVGEDDLDPLINFLDFINNVDDETFGAQLGDLLDTEAFATYLAFQELIGNADDIDGRGNNSYLHFDYETEMFTVVNWDLNLAFDTANVGGGGQRGGGAQGGALPEDGARPAGPGRGGPGAQADNVLVNRFMTNDTFAQMYNDAVDNLTGSLFGNGAASDVVATWVEVLSSNASNIVDTGTIEAEAAAIFAAMPSSS